MIKLTKFEKYAFYLKHRNIITYDIPKEIFIWVFINNSMSLAIPNGYLRSELKYKKMSVFNPDILINHVANNINETYSKAIDPRYKFTKYSLSFRLKLLYYRLVLLFYKPFTYRSITI